jgi:membrane protein implicated in regulation of membrane protease activity
MIKFIKSIIDSMLIFGAIVFMVPSKRLDRAQASPGGGSDLVGRVVPVSEEVTDRKGKVRYSGIDWNAKLEAQSQASKIGEGDFAKIVSVEGNILVVSVNN